jgi:hypothetical protein
MSILDSFKWEAIFYDGQIALPHKIHLTLETDKLQVFFTDSQESKQLDYSNLELVQKPKDGLNAILRNTKLPNSQIIICKECFLDYK